MILLSPERIPSHSPPALYCCPVLLSMLMKIFLSRSHPAPDMPLGLVHIQHLARFSGKGRIDLEEPFGDIFMYRTFVILYDIISNLHGSLFNIIFQKNPPANIIFTMYAGVFDVMPLSFKQRLLPFAIFLNLFPAKSGSLSHI